MNLLNVRQPIVVRDGLNYQISPDWARVDAIHNEEGAELLLEAATLGEVEHAYIGHELTDDGHTAMFEAISTTRTALARSMRAFARKLNQALSGTDIFSLVTGPDAEGAEVGGVEISKVRKVAGIPILVARMGLSDGQSVSLIFHSPTSNGNTIQGSDVITVFRFLLNKRDVTHVVAPQSGNDISLNQVAMLLGRLISTNSSKFQRQQSIAKRTRDELDSAVADLANLEQRQNDLTVQADQAAIDAAKAEQALENEQNKAEWSAATTARLTAERDDLKAELERLKTTARTVSQFQHPQEAYADGYHTAARGGEMNPPAGLSDELRIAWERGYDELRSDISYWENQGGDFKDFIPNPNPIMPGQGHGERPTGEDPGEKMEEDDSKQELADGAEDENLEAQDGKDQERQEEEDHTSAFFWYGLRTRPAGPGAVPDGVATTLSVEETAELAVVQRKAIPEEWYRYGAVGYTTTLTQADIQNYSLTDFANVTTQKSSVDLVATLKDWVKDVREDHPEMTVKEFVDQYFRLKGLHVDENPIKDPYTGKYDQKTLYTILRANFPQLQPMGVLEQWWEEFGPVAPTAEELKALALDGLQPLTAWLQDLMKRFPHIDNDHFLDEYLIGGSRKEGLPAEFVNNGRFDQFKLADLLADAYPEILNVGALRAQYIVDVRAGLAGGTTGDEKPEYSNADEFINGMVDFGVEISDQHKAMIRSSDKIFRTAREAAENGSADFRGGNEGDFDTEQEAIAMYIDGAMNERSVSGIFQAFADIQVMLQFKSDDITEWQYKQDELDRLIQQLSDAGAYDDQVKSGVDVVAQYLVDNITNLDNAQRDIETGVKETVITKFPMPADLTELTNGRVAALIDGANIIRTGLENARKAFGLGSVADAVTAMTGLPGVQVPIFKGKNAEKLDETELEAVVASIESYLSDPQTGRSREAFETEILNRQKDIEGVLEILGGQRDRLKQEWLDRAPERAAAREQEEQIKAHLDTVEEALMLTTDQTSVLRDITARLRTAILALKDLGAYDANLEDIKAASQNLATQAVAIAKRAMG